MLETRFSLEEMDYLNGLPSRDVRDRDERNACITTHWICARGDCDPDHIFYECHQNGCDIAAHWHEGRYYMRHGEALARMAEPESDERWMEPAESDVILAWLDGCHAAERGLA